MIKDIDDIVQSAVIFNPTNELKMIELANNDTKPTENHQDIRSTPLFDNHASLPHSPLTETSAAPSKPPPLPCIESKDAIVLERAGDLTDFRLLGDNDMIFGVYQDWVHQNPGNQLDGRITKDGKWQAR